MKVEVYPSASGDCLLLTSADGKTLLADAGLPTAYDTFIAEPLAEMRKAGEVIDVAYVSHIDRDHIGGILRMLDHEMKWRVYEHMKAKGRRFREPRVPRPPQIGEIWHNAFLETIAETEAIQLETALATSAGALATLNAAALGSPKQAALAAKTEMLALSVGDAIEVNWRIGADQLDIPLNPNFDGDFM
ncbi:MAG: MBL fold metallo-hydrolase, partial [Hyphomicrobiales bacterium]|nr:MBL fold metallo-hydrolase [Hyphomicrobiales bacterium]